MLSLSRRRAGEYPASFIKNGPNQYDQDIRINDPQLQGTTGSPPPAQRQPGKPGTKTARCVYDLHPQAPDPRRQKPAAPSAPSVPSGVVVAWAGVRHCPEGT